MDHYSSICMWTILHKLYQNETSLSILKSQLFYSSPPERFVGQPPPQNSGCGLVILQPHPPHRLHHRHRCYIYKILLEYLFTLNTKTNKIILKYTCRGFVKIVHNTKFLSITIDKRLNWNNFKFNCYLVHT